MIRHNGAVGSKFNLKFGRASKFKRRGLQLGIDYGGSRRLKVNLSRGRFAAHGQNLSKLAKI